MKSVTLHSLLRVTLDGLESVYVAEGAGCAGMPSLDGWANLLRAIDDTGADVRELPAALRLSRRAVRTRVESARRRGWIEEIASVSGQKTVRITESGARVVARWNGIQAAAEERWRTGTGTDRSARLRASLENVVARMPLEHPHYPASYGIADARVTGGSGRDWKAVLRRSGDTTSFLPFSALLSQALVAFAMGYEERSPVALSLSTTVLKQIPTGGRPLLGLGPSAGISALHRHGFVNVTDGAIFLTERGLAVSQKCEGWMQAVEADWRRLFGEQPVSGLRQALEELRGGLSDR